MSQNEQQYLNLCQNVLNTGMVKTDRTGTGTKSLFGYQMRFNLEEGFPLLTTKRVPFKLIVSELLWFIKGDTNIRYLLQHGNHIWNEWAFKRWIESEEYNGPDMTDFGRRSLSDPAFSKKYKEQMELFVERILADDSFANTYGDLGNVYGKQWRSWQTSQGTTIDQLKDVIQLIKEQPDSRRMMVTAWNPEDVPSNMALPPCHTLFQFYVAENKLSCHLYQRSADVFLGVPFNIASYALLTHLIANECGLEVGEFVHTLGDAHVYLNHVTQVEEQLSREMRSLPKLNILTEEKSIFDIDVEEIKIEGYQPHPTISAPIAV